MLTRLICLLAIAMATAPVLARPFTYQGVIEDDGGPVTGDYDLRFTAYTSAMGGTTTGSAYTTTVSNIENGLVSTQVDLGDVDWSLVDGPGVWLEIEVRPSGTGPYETLSPRQAITAAPVAGVALEALSGPFVPIDDRTFSHSLSGLPVASQPATATLVHSQGTDAVTVVGELESLLISGFITTNGVVIQRPWPGTPNHMADPAGDHTRQCSTHHHSADRGGQRNHICLLGRHRRGIPAQ